jgi:hypothetical protein
MKFSGVIGQVTEIAEELQAREVRVLQGLSLLKLVFGKLIILSRSRRSDKRDTSPVRSRQSPKKTARVSLKRNRYYSKDDIQRKILLIVFLQ